MMIRLLLCVIEWRNTSYNNYISIANDINSHLHAMCESTLRERESADDDNDDDDEEEDKKENKCECFYLCCWSVCGIDRLSMFSLTRCLFDFFLCCSIYLAICFVIVIIVGAVAAVCIVACLHIIYNVFIGNREDVIHTKNARSHTCDYENRSQMMWYLREWRDE